ncbi:MAG: hypothetical protein WCJ66_00540 [Verrucomicrobiota bacterium]
MKTRFTALALTVFVTSVSASEQHNLLRNGSFEGSLLYWHNLEPKDYELVRDANTPAGEFALKLKSSFIMSAPFVAKRGESYTVSFFAKGEKPGRVDVSMPPSAREVGQKSGRLWVAGAGKSAEITTEWQRLSFTWVADVPADGFWPNPHYLVQIAGEKGHALFIDGVTVTEGKLGTPAYVPRCPLEAVADCANLPGWDGAAGNAFVKGATAQMVAHVANPGKTPRDVIVRWQLVDYEGEMSISPPSDKTVTIPAGKTYTATTPVPLTRNGFIFARLSVLDSKDGATVIDKSDFPLTSIPYPKNATKPDYRERFGGSFAGREEMLKKFQRLGFGWTRWFPETKWQFFQPQAGDPFNWHDEDFALASSYGVSQHVVLYGWPKGLMDTDHSQPNRQPLPLDMKWRADDPRWDDLTIETAWDKFVKAAAAHFKGKSIIFELSNEPEFDKWDKFFPEYAKFTIRTAKLIRATDPKAKIMLNNVYGIPSPLNAAFFDAGGLKYIDVVSWHDYHSGWLTDAQGIKRMKQRMEEAGGKHVEIWFNEGWAYTNTAVDEPIACTNLTSAESTNAQAASVAEMTAAGQEKTILFHTGYEDHGQSFWDYSGPGTLLWDWYKYPLPLVAMWNVLNHHIGISDVVGFVRPPGANFTIFQDLRNGKGVMIAYADRESKSDVTMELPDFGSPLLAEDIMGNVAKASRPLILSKTGRPVILHTSEKTPGKAFLAALTPLDRKNTSFVTTAPGATPTYQLPPTWEGSTKGKSDGSVALANGKPIWKLCRLYPDDAIITANYSPLVWGNNEWIAPDHSQGGHPSARIADGKICLGTLGPWGGTDAKYAKIPVLAFIAPQSGIYQVSGSASSKPWEGNAKTCPLALRKMDSQRAAEIITLQLPRDGTPVPISTDVELTAGHELLFVPMMQNLPNNATNLTIENLLITAKPSGPPKDK